eukprot:m.76082 g.76082  ORF g.76082 m.76082 type:complete len:677 (+) comp24857_c0_seq3:397-2427(+)
MFGSRCLYFCVLICEMLDYSSCFEQFTQPTIISSGSSTHSEWNTTLSVEAHRQTTSQFSFTTRSFCYQSRCSYPAPTIHVHAGDTFSLTIINNLGPNGYFNRSYTNGMHSPNTTNIHLHGMHIDPLEDNVFLEINPGETMTYTYHIPHDHAPGVHWYHSHRHGAATLHIFNGLCGAFVVLPTPADNLPTSITGKDSYLAVINLMWLDQHVDTSTGKVDQGCRVNWPCDPVSQAPLCVGNESTSPFNPFRTYSLQEISRESGSTLSVNPTYGSRNSTRRAMLINGIYQPVLPLVQGSAFILRLVWASGAHILRANANSSQCTITVIAVDGIYLQKKVNEDPALAEGARADIEIVCSVNGLIPLRNKDEIIMFFNVSAPMVKDVIKQAVTDYEMSVISRPKYLGSMVGDDVQVDGHFSISMGPVGINASSSCAYWMGGGSDCRYQPDSSGGVSTNNTNECSYSQFTGPRRVNTQSYVDTNRYVTNKGSINQWVIHGTQDSHPIHMHINHMQIVSFKGDGSAIANGSADFYKVGEFRDTVMALPGALTVRFRTADFTGEALYHCHFLRHEDLGMMDSFLIVDSPKDYSRKNATIVAVTVPTCVIIVVIAMTAGALRWKKALRSRQPQSQHNPPPTELETTHDHYTEALQEGTQDDDILPLILLGVQEKINEEKINESSI